MGNGIEPALLANYAERPRVGDWTLRSALVRLAQADPSRAGGVLEVVRRCDSALAPHVKQLEAGGAAATTLSEETSVSSLLEAARLLDDVGEALAGWAADGAKDPPPLALLDERCRTAFAMLDDLGVPLDQRLDQSTTGSTAERRAGRSQAR